MTRAAFMLLAPAVLAGCMPEPSATRADADPTATFATFCSDCHGAGGQGDGPLAAGLDPRPADLTRIAARNGGTFDKVAVMTKIDGYSSGNVSAMPEFGAFLMDAPRVLVETGDGVVTPTPAPLAELADYLASIQG